jgi:hypothetical protein
MPIYLQLPKIKGSSTDAKHRGWITLDSFSFGTPTTRERQGPPDQILRVAVPTSELALQLLRLAVLQSTNVGPGLLHNVLTPPTPHNVVNPTPESPLAKLILNNLQGYAYVEYKIGGGVFIDTAQTPRSRTFIGLNIPTPSSSVSFDLFFTELKKVYSEG